MAAARTIVVGDVHGCIEELDELLRTVQLAPGRDRLVFLGDLVDRGPDGPGVVRRARELGAECVLGNHEEKHLRYAKHLARRRADPAYEIPMRFAAHKAAEHARLSEEDLRWMAALPPYLDLGGGWLAVHAGLAPGVALADQDEFHLLHIRHVDTAGNPHRRESGKGLRPWTEAWTGPQSVAYGHHVVSLEAPRWDHPVPGVSCVGLDTGCCYGGALSALVLPAGEIVQVRARAAWAFRHAAAEQPVLGSGTGGGTTGGPRTDERRRIAQETAGIILVGAYTAPSGREVSIASALLRAVRGRREYAPGAPLPPATIRPRATAVDVRTGTPLAVARRLREEGAWPTVVLPTAVGKPGGGFLEGGEGEEEAALRASALFACLARREMYYHLGQAKDPLLDDWVLLAKGVPVFRDEVGALLEEPWLCSFASCPAPNARAALATGISPDAVRAALRARVLRLLAAARARKLGRLVIGAWGLGTSGNDPREVAAAFADALAGPFHGCFRGVHFVLKGKGREGIEALGAYRERFGGW